MPVARRLLLLTLTLLVFGCAATAAQAGVVQAIPSIVGQGTIIGIGSCVNPTTNEQAVQGCGAMTIGAFNLTAQSLDIVAFPGNNPAGHWRVARWEGCTSVTGNTCRLTTPSNVFFRVFTPRVVFDDFVGPTVTSISPAHSTTVDRGLNFSSTANETTIARNCRVDGGAAAPCGTVRQFSEGTHQVRAQATDVNGNVGSLSAPVNFRVIDTQLVRGPDDFSSVKRPTFTYSSLSGLDFRCSIDSVAITTPCGPKDASNRATFTPPADLPDGTHTLRVQAFDGPEFDRVALVRTWVVDTVRPETTLNPLLGPGQDSIVTALTAEFGFSSNEVGTIQCRLDSAPFAPCTSPKSFADLPFGDRRFEARAVDRAGNVDATPATRRWNIQARDNDGDGFNQRTDCDDGNAGVNPARPELLENGVDENCDGVDGVNLDRDGDGVERPADCNDGNPGIRPGANDVPNNGVDEDCQGGDLRQVVRDEQVERIVVTLSHTFSAFKKFTKLSVMQVKAVPLGSKVTVTCKVGKRKKCPGKARKRFTKKNAFGTISLKKYTKRKLKVGTTITVTVTKPGAIGAVKIFTVRKGKKPKVTDRCLPPGARKPVAC